MPSFSTAIQIEAPPERVWHTLADIGEIARWNPGVRSSHLLRPASGGPGDSRYCDLGSGNYLEETVAAWEPGEALTMRITATNLPIAAADIHFRMEPAPGGTHVEVAPEYRLKFGLLGRILDRLYVRRQYLAGMRALLGGLKEYVEISSG
jgi:uncharacterized protein YndB with AHSA1/START domain